jgi:Mrp family chromosome partitioning ATPase
LSGKKVLLIGMDFRNPRLNEYMVAKSKTNYLSSNDLDLNDLIVKHDGYKNFHILSAGAIPPNPAELLMSGKVDLLLKLCRSMTISS